jgi:hypothetical protein
MMSYLSGHTTDATVWAAEMSRTFKRYAAEDGIDEALDPAPGNLLHVWLCNAIETGKTFGRSQMQRDETSRMLARPIRDLIAAFLRSRGYSHDDSRDMRDLHWDGPRTGVRPMLACLAHEMNTELAAVVDGEGVSGWDRYEVSLGCLPDWITEGDEENR